MDSLKCIVKWLTLLEYEVEDWLLSLIISDGECESDKCMQVVEPNGKALTKEVIQKLTEHVNIREMNATNLQKVASISKGAKLMHLAESCYEAFLNPGRVLSKSKSIPVFLVSHKFFGISKWKAGLLKRSPWTQDDSGFCLTKSKNKNISLHLQMKSCELSEEVKDCDAVIQCFIQNPTGNKIFLKENKATRKLDLLLENDWGYKNLIDFKNLKSISSESYDSAIVGAMIFIAS